MSHKQIIENWQKIRSSDYKAYLKFFNALRENKIKSYGSDLHQEAFKKVNCLECAHCCKTTPALLEGADISRISGHLGLTKKEFIRKYVLEDINGELSLNKVPCHFLQKDNTCAIYEIRPKACREFPHTDDPKYYKRPVLNAKNVMICPAAYYVVEKLKEISENQK